MTAPLTDIDAARLMAALPADAQERLRAEALRRGVPVATVIMEGILAAARQMERTAAA